MTRTGFRFALFVCPILIVFAAAVSCEGDIEQTCEPGRVDDCPCPGGGEGAQTCNDDGSGWGDCACDDDDADAGPDDDPDAGPEGCDGDERFGVGTLECDECFTCAMNGPCAAETAACNGNPECVAWSNCTVECYDDPCMADCDTNYPTGQTLYMALAYCAQCDACPVTCDIDLSICP